MRTLSGSRSPARLEPQFSKAVSTTKRRDAEKGLRLAGRFVDSDVVKNFQVKVHNHPERSEWQRQGSGGVMRISDKRPFFDTVHEAGHHIESLNGEMLSASKTHYAARVKGRKAESLGPDYRPGERAIKGVFFDDYMGKFYKDGSATELITCGLQYFYSDPIEFAKQDPESFEFVYNALRGRFPS